MNEPATAKLERLRQRAASRTVPDPSATLAFLVDRAADDTGIARQACPPALCAVTLTHTRARMGGQDAAWTPPKTQTRNKLGKSHLAWPFAGCAVSEPRRAQRTQGSFAGRTRVQRTKSKCYEMQTGLTAPESPECQRQGPNGWSHSVGAQPARRQAGRRPSLKL